MDYPAIPALDRGKGRGVKGESSSGLFCRRNATDGVGEQMRSRSWLR